MLIECPDCGKILNVPPDKENKKIVCPECGTYMKNIRPEIPNADEFNKKAEKIIKKCNILLAFAVLGLLIAVAAIMYIIILGTS